MCHTSLACGLQSYSLRAYCQNTKFDKLILRIIIKIVATRCHILKVKCTRELTALPVPHSWIQQDLLLRKERRRTGGKGKGGGKEGRGPTSKAREGEKRKVEGRVSPPQTPKPNFAHYWDPDSRV